VTTVVLLRKKRKEKKRKEKKRKEKKRKEKKRKEKVTLFSDHNGSLPRRQPGEPNAVEDVFIRCNSLTLSFLARLLHSKARR